MEASTQALRAVSRLLRSHKSCSQLPDIRFEFQDSSCDAPTASNEREESELVLVKESGLN